jgi:hypothetical protein
MPVWYVAPLEMNEKTHWGQGYNQPPTGCSAEERPNKRPLTLTLTARSDGFIFGDRNPSTHWS